MNFKPLSSPYFGSPICNLSTANKTNTIFPKTQQNNSSIKQQVSPRQTGNTHLNFLSPNRSGSQVSNSQTKLDLSKVLRSLRMNSISSQKLDNDHPVLDELPINSHLGIVDSKFSHLFQDRSPSESDLGRKIVSLNTINSFANSPKRTLTLYDLQTNESKYLTDELQTQIEVLLREESNLKREINILDSKNYVLRRKKAIFDLKDKNATNESTEMTFLKEQIHKSYFESKKTINSNFETTKKTIEHEKMLANAKIQFLKLALKKLESQFQDFGTKNRLIGQKEFELADLKSEFAEVQKTHAILRQKRENEVNILNMRLFELKLAFEKKGKKDLYQEAAQMIMQDYQTQNKAARKLIEEITQLENALK